MTAQARKVSTPGLVLQAAPCPSGGDELRLGFTCSKKIGNAVARNRARRRLRAAAQAVMPDCALPGHDYVLIGRAETVDRPYALLLQDLRFALKRVGAMRAGAPSGAADQSMEGSSR